MASILDEYEDSLSRSAVLQPGCPSVGIPHSGKGRESTAIPLGFPGTCTGRVGTVASKGLVHFMDVHYGSKSLILPHSDSSGPQLVDGRSLKEPQEQQRYLGLASRVFLRGN